MFVNYSARFAYTAEASGSSELLAVLMHDLLINLRRLLAFVWREIAKSIIDTPIQAYGELDPAPGTRND